MDCTSIAASSALRSAAPSSSSRIVPGRCVRNRDGCAQCSPRASSASTRATGIAPRSSSPSTFASRVSRPSACRRKNGLLNERSTSRRSPSSDCTRSRRMSEVQPPISRSTPAMRAEGPADRSTHARVESGRSPVDPACAHRPPAIGASILTNPSGFFAPSVRALRSAESNQLLRFAAARQLTAPRPRRFRVQPHVGAHELQLRLARAGARPARDRETRRRRRAPARRARSSRARRSRISCSASALACAISSAGRRCSPSRDREREPRARIQHVGAHALHLAHEARALPLAAQALERAPRRAAVEIDVAARAGHVPVLKLIAVRRPLALGDIDLLISSVGAVHRRARPRSSGACETRWPRTRRRALRRRAAPRGSASTSSCELARVPRRRSAPTRS